MYSNFSSSYEWNKYKKIQIRVIDKIFTCDKRNLKLIAIVEWIYTVQNNNYSLLKQLHHVRHSRRR